jgi:hypothetical protein
MGFTFSILDVVIMSNIRKDVRRVDNLNFGCSVFARFFQFGSPVKLRRDDSALLVNLFPKLALINNILHRESGANRMSISSASHCDHKRNKG